MTIYIVFWIVILLMVLLELNTKSVVWGKVKVSSNKISFCVIYIWGTMLGIFRDEFLGVDVLNYRSHFYSLKQMSLINSLKYGDSDTGFYFLTKLLSMFSKDYDTYKAFLYIITFTIAAIIIYRKSCYPAISFMVYFGLGFLGYNFCILRQALAMSVSFWAFKYAKERCLRKFILSVGFASLFHSTAIVFLIVYPIINSKINGISLMKKTLIMIGTYIFGRVGLPYVYRFFHTDYSSYIIQNQGMSKLIMFIIIFMFIQIAITKISFRKKEEFDTAFITIYMQIIALFFSLFTRITQYFSFFLVLVIPEVCEQKKNVLIKIFFIGIFSFLYFWTLNGMNIVPYISTFSNF